MQESKLAETELQACKLASIEAFAPAKLNLTLDVLEKRTDGFHNIQTLYQAVDLQDRLLFDFYPAKEFAIEFRLSQCTTYDTIPSDQNNLINQAAWGFLRLVNPTQTVKVQISLSKHIPIAAGFAGGSADAAATLHVFNHYFSSPLDNEQLRLLGQGLGADIPFCLIGGRAIGQGKGENLTPIYTNIKPNYFVGIKPNDISISTAWAYAEFDKRGIKNATKQDLLSLSGPLSKDLKELTPYFRNAFEPLIFELYPFLADLKVRLIELGCISASLTGKGPTIWGLARDRAHAEQVLEAIADDQVGSNLALWFKKQNIGCAGYLASSVNHGIIINRLL